MEQGTSRELRRLEKRVTAWRSGTGGRRTRIPEELWSEAVKVAGKCGLHATVHATRFNYRRLKTKCALASGVPSEVVVTDGSGRWERMSAGGLKVAPWCLRVVSAGARDFSR